MAAVVEPKAEATGTDRVIESAGLWSARSTKLHQEILAPPLPAATPAALRRAWVGVALIALLLLLIQLISAPIGQRLYSVVRDGTDVNSVWQAYISAPAPDVLFLGASWARADIDEGVVAGELSRVAGHPVTVGKMGFAAQGPLFMDAVMYRIMQRPSRPKLVVVTMAAPDLNGGCPSCEAGVTDGLWQLTDLSDPGFVQLAMHNDPEPAKLVAGWVLPSLAYYPSLLGVQCLAVDFGRAAAQKVLGRVPAQLSAPTICENSIPHRWSRAPAMTEYWDKAGVFVYSGYMSNYSISPRSVATVEHEVNLARAKGTDVVFIQMPTHSDIRSIRPRAQQEFQAEIEKLTAKLNVGMVDLSSAVPDDPTLWVDPVHLDQRGADYLAPLLAGQLGPHLPAS